MLEDLFNKICGNEYECFVITHLNYSEIETDQGLFAIPCEMDGEGGNYPEWDKSVLLSDVVYDFDFGVKDEDDAGILIWKTEGKFLIRLAEYGWDGFC